MACTGSHGLDPTNNKLTLDTDDSAAWRSALLQRSLTWSAVEGLAENLGKNGVTSNYRYDTAPYTWGLVKISRRGKDIYSAPMPIKCAAPQKAMYLSADYWAKGRLADIQIDLVPPHLATRRRRLCACLTEYVERWGMLELPDP